MVNPSRKEISKGESQLFQFFPTLEEPNVLLADKEISIKLEKSKIRKKP